MTDVTLNIHHTINGGSNQTAKVTVSLPDGFDMSDTYALMSLAADALIEKGQVMVIDVDVLETDPA